MAESVLSNSENKDKLNEYLAEKLLELHQGDQILVATYKNTSLVSQTSCVELDQHLPVRPFEAEEADQRLVRHVLNLVHNGYRNILVRTIDTDLLVSLISHVSQIELGDVKIHAYLINSDKYYNIRAIIHALEEIFVALFPSSMHFRVVTLYQYFYGKGKCKSYDVWLNSSQKDELSGIFIQLGESPVEIISDQMDLLENYVLELYGSRATSLVAARLDRFNKPTDNDLRSLPPSKDALYQHVLRSCYQA